MKIRILTAILCLHLSAEANAQEVHPVNVGDNASYGITYSLPATVVKATVEARCTRVVAGPYAPYAEKYLGLKEVAQEDQTRYEIVNATLTTEGCNDENRRYHILFSEKGALPTFFLTEDLCLVGINRSEPVVADRVTTTEVVVDAKPTYKPSDLITPDMLKAGSKSKQAELCAEEIFSIRESRSELIRGEADNTPNDGKQLQLMLDNLKAQEETLLSLFIGTETVTTEVRTFKYLPEEVEESRVLFRFSQLFGFCEVEDMAGAPVYLSNSVIEDNRMEAPDAKSAKKVEKGIAYCVPGKARVILSKIDGKLATADFLMAQFGHVEQLPQSQFTDKKRPCAALFDAKTGAVKLFEQ